MAEGNTSIDAIISGVGGNTRISDATWKGIAEIPERYRKSSGVSLPAKDAERFQRRKRRLAWVGSSRDFSIGLVGLPMRAR
jgi:hypothetical protein